MDQTLRKKGPSRLWGHISGFFQPNSSAFRVFEFLSIIIVLVAFYSELNYRHEERTARAWHLLAMNIQNISGKIEALAYLNRKEYRYLPKLRWLHEKRLPEWWPLRKERMSLNGIDLTPPILAKIWEGKPKQDREIPMNYKCSQYTDLADIELPEAKLKESTLVCCDLHSANLQGAKLQGADLRLADMQLADLRGAILGIEIPLIGSVFKVANLSGVYLKSADLRGVLGINCEQLTQARDWDESYRDEHLSCGEPIPPSPASRNRSSLTPDWIVLANLYW